MDKKILNKIFSLINEFPLNKDIELDIKTPISKLINLFSSLILERITVKLEESFPNNNFNGITLNSNIEEIYNMINNESKIINKEGEITNKENLFIKNNIQINDQRLKLGIDIEYKSSLPIEIFEKSNLKLREKLFTVQEIAYSLSKPDPILTLLGIYSSKEAIKKTFNNEFEYKDCEILHEQNGKPYCKIHNTVFKNIIISISHAESLAIGVCTRF